MDQSLTINLSISAASLAQLRYEMETLKAAIGSSLERSAKARDFLFGGGEQLAPGLIELRSMPAVGTSDMTVCLDITDKFRAFTVALAAGELDGKFVEPVHGRSNG